MKARIYPLIASFVLLTSLFVLLTSIFSTPAFAGSILGWGSQVVDSAELDQKNHIAIAAGGYHSLALKSDGTIVGWGENGSGQATPPAGNNYTAISAGGYHSLALKSDGTIVGWGYNYYGQATPPAGNNYTAISAGWDHSLALKAEHLTSDVTASVRYQSDTKRLTITATAYDKAKGTYITNASATYQIPSLSKAGQLNYNGSVWTATVDLSANPPAPGQYIVKVFIGTGSTNCVFNVTGSSGQIIGIVQDFNKTPLGGIPVNLYNSNSYFSFKVNPIATYVSEPNGFYHFDNLNPGFYVVHVNTSGYLPQFNYCMLFTNKRVELPIMLASSRSLAQLLSQMISLREATKEAMNYETGTMSIITSQAVGDLSDNDGAWDAASFLGDILAGGVGGGLKTIGNAWARGSIEQAITKLVLNSMAKSIAKEGIDRLVQIDAQRLLPQSMNGWQVWSEDDLKGLGTFVQASAELVDKAYQFENTAPRMLVPSDFDFGKAGRVIDDQMRLLEDICQGKPLILIPLCIPEPNEFIALSLPSGYQLWLRSHADISYWGGLNKGVTVVQLGSGVVAGALIWTGVGAGIAGTVCAGATVVSPATGFAETMMKFHGALTYGCNAKGWAQDIVALPLSYVETKGFLEQEAENPYYLSNNHNFSGDATLNLNALPGNILVPLSLLNAAFNIATVQVTNTSDLTATFRVFPNGWWDYHLPGDWPLIGGLFGGVTTVKVLTVPVAPVTVTLAPGTYDIVRIPYMGFYHDVINMFSPHWLQVDVYAGPFLVKSLSQPYYVVNLKLAPSPMATMSEAQSLSPALVASFEKDDRAHVMDQNDYASMLPDITTLATGTVDANTPAIQHQFTVDANTWSVCFKLVSDERAHVALQVYDANNNCVGYDTARGGIRNEFIATYTGNGSGNQDVDIPQATGKTYTAKVVLEGASTAGPFHVQLFAFETPIRPAVLAAMPASVSIKTQPINKVDVGITIGEAGHQQPLHDVTVSLSELTNTNGSAILPIIGATVQDVNDIPAGSSESVSFVASVPKEVPVGEYTGKVTVSSLNAGTITIPVSIINDDIEQDLTRDGVLDVNDIADFIDYWLQTTKLANANGDYVVNFYDLVILCSEWLETGNDLQADFNKDRLVALGDFAILGSQWQKRCSYLPADFNRDGSVDFLDFAELSEKWLWQASWYIK